MVDGSMEANTMPDYSSSAGEWSQAKPRPINLRFGWTETVTLIVVVGTALALDFMAFRASELKKARHTLQREDNDTDKFTNGTALNGNGASSSGSASTSTMDSGSTTCGGKAGPVVAVQPGRWGASEAAKSRTQWKRAFVLSVWILGALISHRIGLTVLARLSAMMGSFVAFLPHLLRTSKYRRDWTLCCALEAGDKRRSMTDLLVWTSFVYIVPSFYGLYAHQYGIAALQLMTTIGSTLFHLTRETKFFNLDNVFATSLLITTVWSIYLGVRHGIWWYVAAIGIGGPFAVFCIVRCGMPGIVGRHPSGHGLCRTSNPEYDFFHMLWHLSSGIGTLVSIHFFEVNFPAEEAGGGWFFYFPDIPIVPTVSLAISALINFYGNSVGVMPLE